MSRRVTEIWCVMAQIKTRWMLICFREVLTVVIGKDSIIGYHASTTQSNDKIPLPLITLYCNVISKWFNIFEAWSMPLSNCWRYFQMLRRHHNLYILGARANWEFCPEHVSYTPALCMKFENDLGGKMDAISGRISARFECHIPACFPPAPYTFTSQKYK